jgi:hypothetical protein
MRVGNGVSVAGIGVGDCAPEHAHNKQALNPTINGASFK